MPTSGDLILFREKNVKISSTKARKFLRYKIGYLFQNYALIDNDSVENNLKVAQKYSRDSNSKIDINEALGRVGLEGFEKRKVFSLSGGEQQRVAMARLYLKPRDSILAAEPTGNLDQENTKLIMEVLSNLNKNGKTVVVVTHDKENLHYFDRIINHD